MRVIDLQTELNALNIKFEPIGYVKAPAYPYGIYLDDIRVEQADSPGSRVETHEVTIELYHHEYDDLKTSMPLVEAWLNSIPIDYRKRITYVIDEDHYCATYTMTYKTKG